MARPSTLVPLPDGGVRMFACGGLGEIGRNMIVLQHQEDSVIIDCGVMFPSDREPGVDLILPDLALLKTAGVTPSHVLLTHGHEDHIGALPYLMREFPGMVIVGSRLTLAFCRAKLQEHGLRPKFIEVAEGTVAEYGPFKVEYLAVAHSVPDGLALAIEVGEIRILHTGDFKLDDDPLDGRMTDLAGFTRIGELGVDLLLSDSTNADVPVGLEGERSLLPVFKRLFSGTPGRVVFACFASNVHRVQQAINAAVDTGRQFAFIGRSMVRNMSIAHQLGFLTFPEEAQLELGPAIAAEPSKIVLISTGSQGEPLSALARMARHEHKIRPQEGDLVILSARLIPGNEADIFRVVNDLNRQGAVVLHTENAAIHATGHAPAVDLRRVIQAVQPKRLVPIHGEWRHMRAHANVAYEAGMKDDSVILMGNGEVLDIVDGSAVLAGSYQFREIYVDGGTVGSVGEETLQERRHLATDGLFTIALAVDPTDGRLLAEPIISVRGLPNGHIDYEEIIEIVSSALEMARLNLPLDIRALETDTVRKVRRWLRERYRFNPFIAVSAIAFTPSEVEL